MTVVEVLIAMTLLAVVMAGLAPAFYASLTAATTANHRTTANGLAVAATEGLRAVPYADLGFYGDQPAPAACSSEPDPVVLGPTTPAGGALVAPSTTKTVGPVTYTVTRCVDWVGADNANGGAPYSDAYKQTAVHVAWTDNAGQHTVSQLSAVYPGGQAPAADAPSATTTTSTTVAGPPSPPTGAAIVDQGAPADQSAIGLTWQPPAATVTPVAYYVVEYNTTGDFSAPGGYATSPPVYATDTIIGSLSPASLYYFNVVSVAGDGTTTSSTGAQTSGSTAGSAPEDCTIAGIAVSPTTAVLDGSDRLLNGNASGGLTVTVTASSSCSDVTVGYTTSGGTTAEAPLSGTGGQLTGTAGTGSTAWDVGNHAFTVYVGGETYAPLLQEQVNFCIENGRSGKC